MKLKAEITDSILLTDAGTRKTSNARVASIEFQSRPGGKWHRAIHPWNSQHSEEGWQAA